MQSRDETKKIRVLIVDDHPTVRMGLRFFLDMQPDMVVCGECKDASDLLAKVAKLRPDVVTVDINLGGESGLDLVGPMRALGPALKILVLSFHEERRYMEHAAAVGAHGYVTKQTATQTLVPTIRELMHAAQDLSGLCHPGTVPPQATKTKNATA